MTAQGIELCEIFGPFKRLQETAKCQWTRGYPRFIDSSGCRISASRSVRADWHWLVQQHRTRHSSSHRRHHRHHQHQQHHHQHITISINISSSIIISNTNIITISSTTSTISIITILNIISTVTIINNSIISISIII